MANHDKFSPAPWKLFSQSPEFQALPPTEQAQLRETHFKAFAPIEVANAYAEKGLPPEVGLAITDQESSWNPNARSPKGAYGLSQLMEATARKYGVNRNDVGENIAGGAAVFADEYKRFGGDLPKALAAYNAGAGAVSKAIQKGGDQWLAYMPAETRDYIPKVLAKMANVGGESRSGIFAQLPNSPQQGFDDAETVAQRIFKKKQPKAKGEEPFTPIPWNVAIQTPEFQALSPDEQQQLHRAHIQAFPEDTTATAGYAPTIMGETAAGPFALHLRQGTGEPTQPYTLKLPTTKPLDERPQFGRQVEVSTGEILPAAEVPQGQSVSPLDLITRLLQASQYSPTTATLLGPTGQKFDAGGGAVATEKSITVEDNRLNKGKPTNIPLLVPGQPDLEGLAQGREPTREEVGHAIAWAAQRGGFPGFNSIEEAVAAAKQRSDEKGQMLASPQTGEQGEYSSGEIGQALKTAIPQLLQVEQQPQPAPSRTVAQEIAAIPPRGVAMYADAVANTARLLGGKPEEIEKQAASFVGPPTPPKISWFPGQLHETPTAGQPSQLSRNVEFLQKKGRAFTARHPEWFAQSKESQEDVIRNAWAEGGPSTVNSVLAMIPGFFVGGVPGMATSGATLFGLSEYQAATDEIDAFNKAHPNDQIPKELASKIKLLRAGSEAALEFASNLISGKLLGLDKLGGITKQAILKSAFTPTVLQALARLSGTTAAEVGTEMATAGIQAHANRLAAPVLTAEQRQQMLAAFNDPTGKTPEPKLPPNFAANTPTPWEAAKGALGPSLFQSVLMFGLGNAVTQLQSRGTLKTFSDPQVPPEKRMQAAQEIGQALQEGTNDANFVKNFLEAAAIAIQRGDAMPLDVSAEQTVTKEQQKQQADMLQALRERTKQGPTQGPAAPVSPQAPSPTAAGPAAPAASSPAPPASPQSTPVTETTPEPSGPFPIQQALAQLQAENAALKQRQQAEQAPVVARPIARRLSVVIKELGGIAPSPGLSGEIQKLRSTKEGSKLVPGVFRSGGNNFDDPAFLSQLEQAGFNIKTSDDLWAALEKEAAGQRAYPVTEEAPLAAQEAEQQQESDAQLQTAYNDILEYARTHKLANIQEVTERAMEAEDRAILEAVNMAGPDFLDEQGNPVPFPVPPQETVPPTVTAPPQVETAPTQEVATPQDAVEPSPVQEQRAEVSAPQKEAPPPQPTITPADIHALAKERNIPSDDDPNFAKWTNEKVKKEHLDDMTPVELTVIADALRAGERPRQALSAETPSAAAPVTSPRTETIDQTKVNSFTTSQGSTYQWDGLTSQRTKTPHLGQDPKDVGLKPRSTRTIFVDPETASLVGQHLGLNRESQPRVFIQDNELVLTNRYGEGWQKERRQAFPFTTTPAVNLAPIEFWDNGSVHPGNRIVSLQQNAPTPAVSPPPSTEPTSPILANLEKLASGNLPLTKDTARMMRKALGGVNATVEGNRVGDLDDRALAAAYLARVRAGEGTVSPTEDERTTPLEASSPQPQPDTLRDIAAKVASGKDPTLSNKERMAMRESLGGMDARIGGLQVRNLGDRALAKAYLAQEKLDATEIEIATQSAMGDRPEARPEVRTRDTQGEEVAGTRQEQKEVAPTPTKEAPSPYRGETASYLRNILEKDVGPELKMRWEQAKKTGLNNADFAKLLDDSLLEVGDIFEPETHVGLLEKVGVGYLKVKGEPKITGVPLREMARRVIGIANPDQLSTPAPTAEKTEAGTQYVMPGTPGRAMPNAPIRAKGPTKGTAGLDLFEPERVKQEAEQEKAQGDLPLPGRQQEKLSREEELAAAEEPATSAASASQQVANWVLERIRAGQPFTNQQLFDQADIAFGGTQGQGTYESKAAYDAMEMGVNQWIAQRGFNKPGVPATVGEQLKELQRTLALLPTQSRRTAEQGEFQQFSTPPTEAYVASWVANLSANDTVLEPSAGVGGLAIFAKNVGAQVVVNELSPRRAALLRQMGFDQVYTENAEQLHNILPADVRPTVILMNPPFSATAGRMQGQRKTENAIAHIEQALKRLEPGGRLVAIVGQGMNDSAPAFRDWWQKIKGQYRVRANISIPGKEYAKYGTTFGNQLVVIDNEGPTFHNETKTGEPTSLLEALSLLEGVRNDRPIIARSGKPLTDQPTRETAPTPSRGEPRREQSVYPPAPLMGGGERRRVATPESPGRPYGLSGDALETQPKDRVPVPPLPPGAPTPGIPTRGATDRGGRIAGEGRGESRETPLTGAPIGDSGAEQPTRGGLAESTASTQPDAAGVAPAELTESVYESYRPAKLRVTGAVPHVSPLVQSAAMASVDPPAVTYTPNLPKEMIASGKISDAQLEAVTYAGQAHERILPNGERQGMFIGDGTGLGKGRENAAIILDNWNQGRKKAVWVSLNSKLLQDAQRDVEGIGDDPAKIFSLPAKANVAIPQSTGILFTTYDTLARQSQPDKTGGPGKTRLAQLTEWLGQDFDGVIILDESHALANARPDTGGRQEKSASQRALAALELQRQLPKARVVYVSATGATEVSNLAYATRLGLWGEGTSFADVTDFINKISEGGLAAMELVARDMKAKGLYLSRSLSFDGVTYETLEHPLTEEQRDIYNTLARAWQTVLQSMNQALNLTEGKSNPFAKRNALNMFWSGHQRFFNQVLTSLQMPSVVRRVQQDLANGDAVVMQIVNTLQAAQDRKIAAMEASPDDEGQGLEALDLTPREGLMDLITRGFPVQQYEEYLDDNGNLRSRPVVDSQGNPVNNVEAVAMREKLLDELGSVRVPEGPLEILFNTFGESQVAEVTGRTRRVVRNAEGKSALQSLSPKKMLADAKAFMDDKKRILIFSNAGGTGQSYHADLNVPNRRKRRHYLLQPGWQADRAIQGMGRTHRTNEAAPPHYVLVTTDVKGQKRFISSVARRLDQLGSLTRGQRQTGGQGLLSARDNLENQYAKDALDRFWMDLARGDIENLNPRTVASQMGLLSNIFDAIGKLKQDLPPITQFLNRVLSLDLETQNAVFDAFSERLDRNIAQAIADGSLDVGMETLKAKSARVVQEQPVYTDPQSGATTNHVELELTHDRKFTTFDSAKQREGLIGFYRHPKSQRLSALYPAASRTTEAGRIEQRYFSISPTSTQVINQAEFEKLNPIEEKAARSQWEQVITDTSPTYTTRAHMLTGALLPIWDRLPSNVRVVRTQTADGKRYLGRLLNENDIDTTLENLGVSVSLPKVTPAEVLSRILEDNVVVELVNGWTLKRSRVGGEPRLEVIGASFREEEGLVREGAFTERIQYSTRLFLPTGDQAEAVMKRVLSSRPVKRIRAAQQSAEDILLSQQVATETKLTSDEPRTVKEESVQYGAAPQEAPVFYSSLRRAIELSKQEKFSPSQAMALLKSPGVKADEVKWVGMEDWLRQQMGPVTKQQMLDFLDANSVQVQEVVKGEPPGELAWQEILPNKEWRAEVFPWIQIRSPRATHFLVESADGTEGEFDSLDRAKEFAAHVYAQKQGSLWAPQFEQYTLPGAQPGSYRELFVTLPVREQASGYRVVRISDNFPIMELNADSPKLEELRQSRIGTSERFRFVPILRPVASWKDGHSVYGDVVNPVVRVRFNERTDDQGRKVLFLEEVQKPLPEEEQKMPPELAKHAIEIGLKRMLRYAAENGYDSLAWITGEQTAIRYDLSKHLSEVHYSGTNLKAYDHNGKAVIEQTGITEQELPQYLGEELAQRLLVQPKRGTLRSLTGLDLRVGGEWAKNLYDRMIPTFLAKYGKKWGAQVGTTKIRTSPNQFDIQGQRGGKTSVHALPITADMKQSVLTEGQSLFEKGPRYVEPQTRAEAVQQGQDVVTDLARPVQVSALKGTLPRTQSGVRTLAIGIAEQLYRQGRVDLRGQQIRSLEDLAVLARVFRDKRLETFRIFYVQDGKIVAHEGVSSRLPDEVTVFSPGKMKQEVTAIQSRIARLRASNPQGGPVQYYLLHNHPGGVPKPSREDIKLTRAIARRVPGFAGHTILDFDTYGVIPQSITDPVTVKSLPQSVVEGEDRLATPAIPHDLLNAPLMGPEGLARIGKMLQTPDAFVTLLYRDAQGALRAIQEMPIALFQRGQDAADFIRGRVREFGAPQVLAYYGGSQDLNAAGEGLIQNGTLTDMVTGDGESLHAQGVVAEPSLRYGRPDVPSQYRVAEEEVVPTPSEATSSPSARAGERGAVAMDLLTLPVRAGQAMGKGIRKTFGHRSMELEAQLGGGKGKAAFAVMDLHAARVATQEVEVMETMSDLLTHPNLRKVMNKIMPLRWSSGWSRFLRSFGPTARLFGVPAWRQNLLFDSAESIKTFINGIPEFGTRIFEKDPDTKELIRDANGDPIVKEWRFTPDQGKALWAQLNDQEKAAVQYWVETRDIIKAIYNIHAELEGYMHHYWNKGFFEGLGTMLGIRLRKKKAGARIARQAEEGKGFEKDFERSIIKVWSDLIKEDEWNQMVKRLVPLVTEPIGPDGVKDGWTRIEKTMPTRRGTFVGQLGGGRQIPTDLYNEMIAWGDQVKDATIPARIARSTGSYIAANLLLHVGTTTANVVGSGMQYATFVLDSFVHGLATGQFRPFVDSTLAPFLSLLPSQVNLYSPELLGSRSGLISQFEDRNRAEQIFGGLLNLTMGTVDNYVKRSVAIAVGRSLGLPTTQSAILAQEKAYAELRRAVDTFGLDYNKINSRLAKFRSFPYSRWLSPYVTYKYKILQLMGHYFAAFHPGAKMEVDPRFNYDTALLAKIGARPQDIERVSRLITLGIIFSLLHSLYPEEEEKTGKHISKMPMSLDRTGMVKVGETKEGKEWWWDPGGHPWFAPFLGERALVRWYRNGDSPYKELLKVIGLYSPSAGPFIQGAMAAAAEQKEPDRTPFGPMIARALKPLMPLGRMAEGVRRLEGGPELKSRTFTQELAEASLIPIPDEWIGARDIITDPVTKEIIMRNPTFERRRFWAGIFLREIDPRQYSDERYQMLRRAIDRVDSAQNFKEHREAMEDVREIDYPTWKKMQPSQDPRGIILEKQHLQLIEDLKKRQQEKLKILGSESEATETPEVGVTVTTPPAVSAPRPVLEEARP